VRETGGGDAVTHCAAMTMWRRREFEAALLAARNDAEDATRARDQFLAVVSHELRTPLSAILGWTRLAQSDQLDDEKRRRALDTIERNARIQSRLIDDLLDVSRMIGGKLRLSPRPIQLAPVIEAAVDTARPTAHSKGIALTCALDQDAGVVYADAERVQQIAWNLIANAVKFTPKGGRAQVTLVRADSRVRLEVLDTGPGISATALPYVFDRFWQADQTSRQRDGGLGLGLSICKSLVELHGATIAAHSDGEGTGTCFVVEFPMALASSTSVPSDAPPEPAPGETSLSGVHVLVVDDHEDARRMLRLLLETSGATVRPAASCDEALAALRERVPHVLVSDIGLPERDGYELIRQVRGGVVPDARHLPAIAVTGMTRAHDRVGVLRAGFQAHLCKPVEPGELVALIGALTRYSRPRGTSGVAHPE
jgi:CheY-like chemotaxis protein